MLLAVDIGNSEITIGLWSEGSWLEHWRLSSRADEPELFYSIRVSNYFLEAGLPLSQVTQVVLSSVVPDITRRITNALSGLFQKEVIILNPGVYERLPVKVLNPYEIGSDLVANAIAAYSKFKKTSIVVDFGTALTFTTVSAEGKILGVSIAPGLQTAIMALSQNTAKLFEVPLEMPASALGISTVTAIQSGVLIGYDGLVRKIVEAIRTELNEECYVIATGGLWSKISSLNNFFHTVEPKLTLDGLRIIGELFRDG